ncbi:Hypothetical Protein FCC1311_096122 [Hondaea fermentalgiana]|uniref:MARVEL domain-containing protein n=1 Tax=Hondaea fermentalgiana TaxID=2315210 RepID=A0A2R5GSV4_9STRA|nr:Hypothetical Protein FCC1311_096122 [Hondaea fermentalgiana]|eukprot:GBG33389.1 Hypothetical Protein FCC1311_096122 [Hondaea fermentalgiana]
MDDFDLLTLLWSLIQVFLVIFVLFSWFGAAGGFKGPSCSITEKDGVTDHHEAFILVWFTFCAVAVSVGGTLIMKKHRTPIGVGLFVGAIFMLFNWTLCTAVLLGGQINKKKSMNADCAKDFGVTADTFALLCAIALFLLYGAFGGLLIKAKDQLLGDEAFGREGGLASEYPTGAFQEIDSQEGLTAV